MWKAMSSRARGSIGVYAASDGVTTALPAVLLAAALAVLASWTSPVRAAPVLAAALKVTVPLPVPAAPAVIVTQAALLVAVHAQPARDVTPVVPVPPAAGKFWLVGLIV